MPESVQSCFELPIHFPEIFSCKLFLTAVHGWFTGKDLQTNVWNCQNATRCFLAQLRSSVIIFSVKSFSYCQKFAIHELFRSEVL